MFQPISKTDLISEISAKYPKVTDLLAEYGLACAHCYLNKFDTIEIGAQLHGMTPEDIDSMVRDINSQLESEADTSAKS